MQLLAAQIQFHHLNDLRRQRPKVVDQFGKTVWLYVWKSENNYVEKECDYLFCSRYLIIVKFRYLRRKWTSAVLFYLVRFSYPQLKFQVRRPEKAKPLARY